MRELSERASALGMSERRQVAAEETRPVPRARPEAELDGGKSGGGGRRVAVSSGAEHDDGHLLGIRD